MQLNSVYVYIPKCTIMKSVGRSVYLHVCLYIGLNVWLSICMFVCLSVSLDLSVCLSVCMPIRTYVSMCACLSVCSSVYLSIFLSVCVCPIPLPSANAAGIRESLRFFQLRRESWRFRFSLFEWKSSWKNNLPSPRRSPPRLNERPLSLHRPTDREDISSSAISVFDLV